MLSCNFIVPYLVISLHNSLREKICKNKMATEQNGRQQQPSLATTETILVKLRKKRMNAVNLITSKCFELKIEARLSANKSKYKPCKKRGKILQ